MNPFKPKFTITNRMTAAITRIERARGFLEAAQLSADWVREMGDRALVLEPHHTTHIEGTRLTLDQAERLWKGEAVQEADPDDVPISEETFRKIQESLYRLYLDAVVPKDVRRRILEASVRAPQSWHQDAIRAAYSSDDEDWRLTAVFSMRWVRGFDSQILEALESNNQDIHYQAICAAGNWEVDAAWPHISRLISAQGTDKPLLLAAIDAAAGIRPQEAGMILVDLTDSEDEDIGEAAHEAMAMAEALSGDEFDDV